MRYFPQRARRKLDISLLLKVCPDCLGDLVFHSDFSGDYYRCLQCNSRTEPRSEIGRLAELTPAVDGVERAVAGQLDENRLERHHSDEPESSILEGDILEARLWEQSDPRIFTTDPDNPDDARVFIWVNTQWFERIEDEETGAVEFSPLSMDEHTLREWLSESGVEITEIDDEFARDAREEFMNEEPLYMEAPELSNQEVDTEPN